MNCYHPNERNNAVVMDGKADEVVQRRTAIKLSEGPKIMVVIPIGGKVLSSVLICPQCAKEGKEHTRFEVNEGFTAQAHVPIQFMLSQMNWLLPLNVTIAYMVKAGMLSAQARQIMTQETKRIPTVKYVFYVDDDMIIPPMGLYTLYNAMEQHPEWGAVSGVYTTRLDPPEPLIYTKHGDGAAWDFEMGPGAAPTQIMGAGAGCLLARVDAIKSWEEANPDTAIWCDSSEFPAANGGRVTWGHDVRFIRNLTEAGWPCFVDGRVLCGHYDAKTNTSYNVPVTAPGFKKRNVNTEAYWDSVYVQEGFASWRNYEAMFGHITNVLDELNVRDVFELGCGPGILGQRLTAANGCRWAGIDMSDVAVAQARARYLNAHKMDVRDLGPGTFDEFAHPHGAVVATEVMEHLDWEDTKKVVGLIQASSVDSVVFSTPWECMPPEEVPEHRVLVNQEWLDAVCVLMPDFQLTSSVKVDESHRVHVWRRKGT